MQLARLKYSKLPTEENFKHSHDKKSGCSSDLITLIFCALLLFVPFINSASKSVPLSPTRSPTFQTTELPTQAQHQRQQNSTSKEILCWLGYGCEKYGAGREAAAPGPASTRGPAAAPSAVSLAPSAAPTRVQPSAAPMTARERCDVGGHCPGKMQPRFPDRLERARRAVRCVNEYLKVMRKSRFPEVIIALAEQRLQIDRRAYVATNSSRRRIIFSYGARHTRDDRLVSVLRSFGLRVLWVQPEDPSWPECGGPNLPIAIPEGVDAVVGAAEFLWQTALSYPNGIYVGSASMGTLPLVGGCEPYAPYADLAAANHILAKCILRKSRFTIDNETTISELAQFLGAEVRDDNGQEVVYPTPTPRPTAPRITPNPADEGKYEPLVVLKTPKERCGYGGVRIPTRVRPFVRSNMPPCTYIHYLLRDTGKSQFFDISGRIQNVFVHFWSGKNDTYLHGSWLVRATQIMDELQLRTPWRFDAWPACDCERVKTLDFRDIHVFIHVKNPCACADFDPRIINILDQIDNFYNRLHRRRLKTGLGEFFNATLVQTISQKKFMEAQLEDLLKRKLVEKYETFSRIRVFIVPHHTGVSLRSVTSPAAIHADSPPQQWTIGGHSRRRYADALTKILNLTNLADFPHRVELFLHFPAEQSVTQIHEAIATLDLAIIWHHHYFWTFEEAAKIDLCDNDLMFKPYQRAANHAASGVPIILTNAYQGHVEFAEIRTDLEPYPYLVTPETLGETVRTLADASQWREARAHVMKLAECVSMDNIARVYIHIISHLIEESLQS